MRFDLIVNEFTKEFLRKELVFSKQLRPYCHVKDLQMHLLLVLEAPKNKVALQCFNVGDTKKNYTKK